MNSPAPRSSDAATLIEVHGPLPLELVADIVTAVADQLDAWAREGMVYGTVQPDQIEVLLDQGNLVEARLTGFPSRPEVLSPTVLMANARYVAPELVRSIRFEPTADLWALGRTTFELLAATLPFASGTAAEMMEMAARGVARHRGLPGDVDVVIGTVLAPDPRDRYETAGEFAAALRRACGCP